MAFTFLNHGYRRLQGAAAAVTRRCDQDRRAWGGQGRQGRRMKYAVACRYADREKSPRVAEWSPCSRSEQSGLPRPRVGFLAKFSARGFLTAKLPLLIFSRWGPAPSSRKDSCDDRQRMTTMIDEQLARLRTHRDSIGRYRRLLQTKLTDLERQFIERRLSEEQSDYERLTKATFPIVFKLPTPTEPAAPHEAA